MFIITEDTPNPDVKKFVPGEDVMGDKPVAEFQNAEEAKISSLAVDLFHIDGVKTVFFGNNFVSVTKTPETEWKHIRLDIIDVITEHYITKRPLFITEQTAPDIVYDEADKELVEQIIELIDTRVRPAVAQDGGDISFHGFDKGVVYLKMKGACSGCPSSSLTLKSGIENMLKHYIPEVSSVQAV